MSLSVDCIHWVDCGVSHGGCCAIGAYDRPSYGVCLLVCQQYDGPARGAGDMLKNLIQTATVGLVEPCGGCKERQAALNRILPSAATKEALT